MPVSTVAAIDCGTNSTRLLVEDDDGRPLSRLMRITRLGEGVDRDKRLAPQAIARVADALTEFRKTIDHFDVPSGAVRMTATSAARDATNREDFFSVAEAVVGVRPELLDGDEEGRLSFLGATGELSEDHGLLLVVDIGGGSTELVVGVAGETPTGTLSLDAGCVRLTERWIRHDPVRPEELANAIGEMRDLLEDADRHLPELREAERLVGLAGTVTTVAALDQGLAEYDRDRIHHYVLSRDTIEDWFRTMAMGDHEDRLGNPGLEGGASRRHRRRHVRSRRHRSPLRLRRVPGQRSRHPQWPVHEPPLRSQLMGTRLVERLLMGPGPCNPYPEATAAFGLPMLGHLDPVFLAVLDETCDRLRSVFRTTNARTLPVSGTGSAGMETCFVNFVGPGDTVVVGVNGLFGERMCEVARRCGADVVRVDAPWGQPLDTEQLVGAHPAPKVIALVHAETSTGVENDVAAVGAAKGDALLLADCVTSLAGSRSRSTPGESTSPTAAPRSASVSRPDSRRSRSPSGHGPGGSSRPRAGISISVSSANTSLGAGHASPTTPHRSR